MCGLCGELSFDGRAVTIAGLTAMRDQLVHRGPDSAGIYVSPRARAGLGFRRLKIVDLSEQANQPLPNEDRTVHVVFNGEIYNFQSLRRDLERRGHIFRSRTDTEVIVHAYEEYGPDCIEKLDGMFAIAIWDDRLTRLILARDRTGKKPLFYLRTANRLVFASEIKAFFTRPDLQLAIDPRSFADYFIHGYVPCPNTFYRDVRQLEPGTVATVNGDGVMSVRRYWALEFPPEHESPVEPQNRQGARERVRQLMSDAVQKRLIADVPLGAFLSGGVDSTIVVGLMSRLLDTPVRTFSIGFKNSPEYDETSYARLVARRFRTDHTEFIVEHGAFDLVDKLVWHHDGPFGDSSAVPTFIVSELTRQQVTVVLTGDGGDELFAGYQRFYAALVAERTPASVRRALRALLRMLPARGSTKRLVPRAQRFAAAASLPLEERLTRWSSIFYDDIDDLLAPGLRSAVTPLDPVRHLKRFADGANGVSTLSRILSINFNTYLLDDLLVKTDRCTMANSLEARSPFLDTDLMEYVAMLPDSMKLARGRTKVILREAFADLIPEEIQRRGKMGFGVPFGAWFRGELREPLKDLLLSPSARYTDYLSSAYVHRLVEKHDTGEADLGLPLWTLLCFETWLRALPGWMKTPVGALETL